MVTDRGLARYLARNLVWVGASEEFLKSPRTKRHILYFFEVLKLQKLNEDYSPQFENLEIYASHKFA